ncbi:TIR domain-containing protein [Pseudofrankia sp. BMG5.37]|uniref:toll/interleukin-1 receptor domain-containing protein n=1 Tax=Pseudofrankia sp. BMG5.37 TaxID=3050035 RepID=UPI002893DD9C|nr:TIR domain-containing protein [Pseudofrankia sp. BMG5.37]MDT3444464.1 TIR domain-containing protein [Pseudofrankia sp. BMG5.37]
MMSGMGERQDRLTWDFFISYTQADRVWAEWIAWQLEDAGYRVLFQGWDFVPGAHWMARMSDGVRGSERVLVVLSHAYLTSVYGRHEWEAAFRQDPSGLERKVVPVRVEDCTRPLPLDGVVSFDLFGIPAEGARQRLLDNIRSVREGRAKPTAEPLFPGEVFPPYPALRSRAELVLAFPGGSGADGGRAEGLAHMTMPSAAVPAGVSIESFYRFQVQEPSPAASQQGAPRASSTGGYKRALRHWPKALAVVMSVALVVVLVKFWPTSDGGIADIPHTQVPDTQVTGPDLAAVSRRLANAAFDSADRPDRARKLAIAAYRTSPTTEARGSVLTFLGSRATFTGPAGAVNGIALSGDGKLLAASSEDSTVRVWEVVTSGGEVAPVATLVGHTGAVAGPAFNGNENLLAAGGDDDTVLVWNTANRGDNVKRITGFASDAVKFDPSTIYNRDGRMFIVSLGTQDDGSSTFGEVVADTWDLDPNSLHADPVSTFRIPQISDEFGTRRRLVSAISPSPDGRLVATGTFDEVHLWNATIPGETSQPLATLTYDRASITKSLSALDFSKDGRLLAGRYTSGAVRIWKTTTPGQHVEPMATLIGHNEEITDVAFSDDNRMLFTSSADDTARAWNIAVPGEDIQPLATFKGATSDLTGVAFSDGERLLIASSRDNTVRVWNAEDHGENVQPLATLRGHSDDVTAVALSNDDLLFTAGDDGSVRAWSLDAKQLVTASCQANRLSEGEWRELVPETEMPNEPPCS